MSVSLAARSLRSVWHPCTQMKLHEAQPPIAIASASGPWLHGVDGKRYLDGISSWWVNLFGHSHPRQQMGDAVQALCFLAGANSIFYGDKLLTTGNSDTQADLEPAAAAGLAARPAGAGRPRERELKRTGLY